MKFKCRHRNSDGSTATSFIDVSSRKEAFQYARTHGLKVVEMQPIGNNENKCKRSSSHNVKTRLSESRVLSEDTCICRNSYIIGCFSSLFPVIGWIIALFATFVKYDFRGLIHCVVGSIFSTISLILIVFSFGLYFGQISELAQAAVNLSKISLLSWVLIPSLGGIIFCIGIDCIRLPYRKIINRS